MNKRFIPFSPLADFFSVAVRGGGISPAYAHHLLPWLLKFTLFEPLRLAEIALYDGAIKKHTLEHPPVFILGHWRSGTTYLQNIMRQDSQFAYINLYQTVLPEIALCTEKWLKPALQFATNKLAVTNHFHRIPFDWSMSGEEDVALVACSSMYSPHWGHLFPKSSEKLFEKYMYMNNADFDEQAEFRKDLLWLLKKFSFINKGKRLLLKSPPNTSRISTLLALFPDAKFVYIHRNPVEIFYSNLRFWKVMEQHIFQKLGKQQIESLIIHTYSGLVKKYLQERSFVPAGNLCEVSYERLINEPVDTVSGVYKSLNITGFDDSRRAFEAFTDGQRTYKTNEYAYDKATLDKLALQWDFAFKEWNYAIPN